MGGHGHLKKKNTPTRWGRGGRLRFIGKSHVSQTLKFGHKVLRNPYLNISPNFYLILL
jgi:hypothetical protein